MIAGPHVYGAHQADTDRRQDTKRGQQQVRSAGHVRRGDGGVLPRAARQADGQRDDAPPSPPERRGDHEPAAGQRGDIPGREIVEAGARQRERQRVTRQDRLGTARLAVGRQNRDENRLVAIAAHRLGPGDRHLAAGQRRQPGPEGGAATAHGEGHRRAEGTATVAGNGDLDLVVLPDVLAGVGVGALRPGRPYGAVRACGHHRPVIEATGTALVTDELGGPEPARRVDLGDRHGPAGDTALAGWRGAGHDEDRAARDRRGGGVVTRPETGRQHPARRSPGPRVRTPGPGADLRARRPEGRGHHRTDRRVLGSRGLPQAAGRATGHGPAERGGPGTGRRGQRRHRAHGGSGPGRTAQAAADSSKRKHVVKTLPGKG